MKIEAGEHACPIGASTDERILDGAMRALIEKGARKTSMEEVASEAGVSRMTVYRHFASREELMWALAEREVAHYNAAMLARIAEIESSTPPSDNPVPYIVLDLVEFTLSYLFDHRLANSLFEREPELVLPFVSINADMVLGAVVRAQAPLFDRWRDEGWLPPISSEWLVDWLTRLQMSWRFNPGPAIDPRDPDTVRRLVETFIWPVLDPQRVPAESE